MDFIVSEFINLIKGFLTGSSPMGQLAAALNW